MSTVSVSKGVFVFKNGTQIQKLRKQRKKSAAKSNNLLINELWYQSYKTLWCKMEQKIQTLNNDMFASVLGSLVQFVKCAYDNNLTELPAATLLTGINMPDHAAQFKTLTKEIKRLVSPHVVQLDSQNCNNLKNLVEHMVNQLINEECDDTDDMDVDTDDSDEDIKKKFVKKVKKSQCSFTILQSWYEDLNYDDNRQVVTVIVPDFESFNPRVLQDFILIASNYLNIIPFVLIFGVATSLSALNKALPYHVSSRVNIQVFNSQPSTQYLNNILEEVLFTTDCPFHLGGRLFALFLDVFLFYDFSVTGFIQNFKFAMLEHFAKGMPFALCALPEQIDSILSRFTHADLDNVRRTCFSFRRFVEEAPPHKQVKLLEENEYFRDMLANKLYNFLEYLNRFHVLLKCLCILVADLPKSPLGKQVRELYILATNGDITLLSEFKEAFQLLSFQSRDELENKVNKMVVLLSAEGGEDDPTNDGLYKQWQESLNHLLRIVISSTTDNQGTDKETENVPMDNENNFMPDGNLDRKALKATLLQRSKSASSQSMNRYEKARANLTASLGEIFKTYLRPPNEFVFHELFFANDVSIQNNIIGSHRAAIHAALNDPWSYFHCHCCQLPNEASILSTMPDICIAYKLHLEYGKMINLYDWLQAFLAILDPIDADENEDKREVDPKLQARFTQCVAELEYLGFVKSSKRKTDHVSRLTWGG